MNETRARKRVLLLGSAKHTTTKTIVEYLAKDENIIVTNDPKIESIVEKCKQTNTQQDENKSSIDLDGIIGEELSELISEHDLIISLISNSSVVVVIAKLCIQHKKNMITNNGLSSELKQLDRQFKDSELASLNFTPGRSISDMIVFKIVHEQQEKNGGKIKSFYGWGGFMPNPDDIVNNPLKFKFFTDPLSKLTHACTGKASWIEGGETRVTDPHKVLNFRRPLDLDPTMPMFEGIPQENSTELKEFYGLDYADDVLKGDLVYKGYWESIELFIGVGLVDFSKDPEIKGKKWIEIMKEKVRAWSVDTTELKDKLLIKLGFVQNSEKANKALLLFEYFGFFDASKCATKDSLADSLFQMLYEHKEMKYSPTDTNILFIHNTFIIETREQKMKTLAAKVMNVNVLETLLKVCGYWCGISAQMMLNGEITTKGVFGPKCYSTIETIMKKLEEEDVLKVEYTEEYNSLDYVSFRLGMVIGIIRERVKLIEQSLKERKYLEFNDVLEGVDYHFPNYCKTNLKRLLDSSKHDYASIAAIKVMEKLRISRDIDILIYEQLLDTPSEEGVYGIMGKHFSKFQQKTGMLLSDCANTSLTYTDIPFTETSWRRFFERMNWSQSIWFGCVERVLKSSIISPTETSLLELIQNELCKKIAEYNGEEYIKVITWNLPGSSKAAEYFIQQFPFKLILKEFDFVFLQEVSTTGCKKFSNLNVMENVTKCDIRGATSTEDFGIIASKTKLELLPKSNTEARHFSVQTLELPKKTTLINLHLSKNNASQRDKEIEFVKDEVIKCKGPLIVAGDFNCNPTFNNSPILPLNLAKGDSTTKSGFIIDHIFYSDHFELVESTELRVTASWESNHFAKVAILKWKQSDEGQTF